MISCGEAEEFIPHGREHVKYHPGDVGLPPANPPPPCNSHEELLKHLDNVSLNNSKDWWCIRPSKDGHTEEELYFSGKTTVWSRGHSGKEGSRYTIKSMTCDSSIQQALFATFHTYPDLPALIGEDLSNEPTGTTLPCICIAERDCITVYTDDGQEFFVNLPFMLHKVWVMKYGILLERLVLPQETTLPEKEKLPVLYSLLHPLDEIHPIIQKGSSLPSYAKEAQQTLVFTHDEPSICVAYNSSNFSIIIFKIRRAKCEENEILLQNSFSIAESFHATPLNSLIASHSCMNFSSPISSLAGNTTTPIASRSRGTLLQTPKLQFASHSQIGLLSRTHSPSLNVQERLGWTPSPFKSLHGSKNFLNSTLLTEAPETEPLIPDICLEMLWSAPTPCQPESAFFSEDSVGQKYLCVLCPRLFILKCYKYEILNQANLTISTETVIHARDAAFLSELKMMIVVDSSCSLLLYNGLCQVSRLHIAELSSFNTTLYKDSYFNLSKLNSTETPIRRSSLLTSSRPPSSLEAKFDAGLSPVPSEKPMLETSFLDDPSLPLSSSIVRVRDGCGSRVTLEHSSGAFYRINLPSLWSSTVLKKVITALKYTLPKDVGIQLVNKWYSVRNSPGNGEFSPGSEFELFSKTLCSLIGYDVEKLKSNRDLDMSGSTSPAMASKKFRATESGSDADWEYLLSSSYHHEVGNRWDKILNLKHVDPVKSAQSSMMSGTINTTAPLFAHLPTILFSLHLVYEEFKLKTPHWDLASMIVSCLAQFAADLQATLYLTHYWKDYPSICNLLGPSTQLKPEDLNLLTKPEFFTQSPPNIYEHLISLINGKEPSPFPYIPNVSSSTKKLILLYCIAFSNCSSTDIPLSKFLMPLNENASINGEKSFSLSLPNSSSVHEKIVSLTIKLGLSEDEIRILAPGLSLLLLNAQHMCRTFPYQDWDAATYKLIQRPDLVLQKIEAKSHNLEEINDQTKCYKRKGRDPYNIKVRILDDEEFESNPLRKGSERGKEEDDGMEMLDWSMLSLRWPEDQRVIEVRKMFASSSPVIINITQRPEVSDHDFLEEQERHLFAMCTRTMALPMGRGMFTYCTHTPIITEPLPIPSLCLKGKAPPRGTSIDFSSNEVPADMDNWPLFHNGVAAGLRIAPNCDQITSTWIAFNKSKGDNPISHAGFLMALGLNGHLRNPSTVSLHDYLSQGHELTNVGLLLGMSAAMRGTMDMSTTKVLSIHLECLLPPTSTELDMPHSVQVAAIMGVGLVYADTAHRHMAEVLLREIGRPPGPEMENSNDREAYSLAAGLSLGLVMFGRGSEEAGFTDLNLAGALYHYIEGGHKRPLSGALMDKYKSPSYQIKEGERVNTNVTSAGSTLALGMIYFRSGNKSVADWMLVPSTPYLLDQVRPDFLLLRTIAKGLILWDYIMPSYKWIEDHVPTSILQHVHRSGNQSTPGIDYESIHQAYYNTLAGACFVLGLKFAGSANSEAFHVLWKYTRMFIGFAKRSIAELAGKSTIETCLSTILLSLSLVMAGTGDLEVLRIIRFLRSRVGPTFSTVGYGSHMALHMALGFLFLGGGRFSLGTSNMSLAALLISCFPKFPTHSNDNRYHLQAFRHLYVLAAEPRLLMPVDVDTGQLRLAKVLIRFTDTRSYQDQYYVATAPHMLPELSKLSEVIFEGDIETARYWHVRFSKNSDSWDVLEALLKRGNGVPLKLKVGRFPYGEIPPGSTAKMPQLVTQEKSAHWTIQTNYIEELFPSSAPLIQAHIRSKKAGGGCSSFSSSVDLLDDREKSSLLQPLSTLIFEYLSVGKPEVICTWVNLIQGLMKISELNEHSSLMMWQIKLLSLVASAMNTVKGHSICSSLQAEFGANDPNRSRLAPLGLSDMEVDDINGSPLPAQLELQPLVSLEQSLSLKKRLESLVDTWHEEVKNEIDNYINGSLKHSSMKCAFVVLMKDIPCPSLVAPIINESQHPLLLLQRLQESGLSPRSVMYLVKKKL